MKIPLRHARWTLALSAAAFLQNALAAELPLPEPAPLPLEVEALRARRAEHFLRAPAPTHLFGKLHSLYSTWRMREALGLPDPWWLPEVPEPERNALKEALKKPRAGSLDTAKKLLLQARALRANSETRASADRLVVLAATEGAYDLDALIEISRFSPDATLPPEARKFTILAAATGQPLSKLSELGIPLPDIAQYKGSPVAIVFWATWNREFQSKWPEMKESLEKFKQSGFKIVGINFDDDKQKAAAFIENEKIDWPSIHPDGHPMRFGFDYNVKSLPWLWIVDEQGNVVSTQVSHQLTVKRTFISKEPLP